MDDRVLFLVALTSAPPDDWQSQLLEHEIAVVRKQNFSGVADEYVLVATTLAALRMILRFTLDMARLSRVSKIELDGGRISIENPQPSHIEALLAERSRQMEALLAEQQIQMTIVSSVDPGRLDDGCNNS